ncbi:gamma-glutamyltransferase family protein [Nesterenkonia muleiensis]|uniref:gamma-glutamyltransferase family protein n=1 Tax=Nesterenkonia muleiensis TaxID=2282648 RepID=UPI000E709D7C|nr:gamma-glutamyltransferase [Nesterenkonia muleiensis]
MPIAMPSNPVRAIAPLALASLLVTSCGIFEADTPEPPDAEQTTDTGQQPNDAESDESPQDEETSAEPEPEEPHLSQQGVSAGNREAVDVATDILEQGGNAVDATIAAAFAVSVVEPVSSGIGGGGSVIVAAPEGDPVFYDYREVVNTEGQIPASQTGIPGFAAGMGQLHADHGQLEWEELIAPAIALAEEGTQVAPYLAERITTGNGPEYLAGIDVFAPGGAPLSPGDTITQPELAQTLQRLADAGWEDYYTGELAESLSSQSGGINTQSLEDYEVVITEPVRGDLGDYQVVSAAPALPGAALIQLLHIAEAQGIAEMTPDSPEYVDTLSRAWAVAEDTIQTELGDPDFVDVPIEEITDPGANATIDASGADQTPQAAPVAPVAPEETSDPNTTHISVIDQDGLTVSMTNTLTDFWGSGQFVDGYFLNNALSRYTTIDSQANQPEPGRRSVTWSNPTMVFDDQDRPVMAIGSPGGIQLIPALSTVITQWTLHGSDLQAAVNSARYRSEGNLLYLEEGQLTGIHTELNNLGWQIQPWPRPYFGSVQALTIDYDTGTITGADDPRRAGTHRIMDE